MTRQPPILSPRERRQAADVQAARLAERLMRHASHLYLISSTSREPDWLYGMTPGGGVSSYNRRRDPRPQPR